MKEKIMYHGIPIDGRMPLFTVGNRQAIRDKLKTQTRRPIDPQPVLVSDAWRWKNIAWGVSGAQISDEFIVDHCPYENVGDVRCMCEPLMRGPDGMVYCSDDRYMPHAISLITGKRIPWRWKRDTLASIHMPTEAARTVCRVTDIRVERVQEITGKDAENEIGGWDELHKYDPISEFSDLWESIYAKRGLGWYVNPWVWVIEFRNVV